MEDSTSYALLERKDSASESHSSKALRFAIMTGIILGTSLGSQNDGICTTWPNVFASDMESDNSTIFNTSLQVADWQLDFMSSIYFIGSIPMNFISGILVAWLGRRWCMVLCSIPGAIGWILVALGHNVPMIFVGRYLCGAAHTLQGVAVRSYLPEISEDRFRGAAGTTSEVMRGLGSILIIALGIFLPWYYTAIFGASHFLLFGMVVAPLLPRSPSHLVMKGKEEAAIKILEKLRGPSVDHRQLVRRLKKENENAAGTDFWRVFLKPDMFKRYLIVAGLFLIANLSGVEVIRANATRMLQKSGLAFDKDVTTMIVFCVLLTGNVSQILMLDWIGRRKCLVVSLSLLVISYTFLGTYMFVNTGGVDASLQEYLSSETTNVWRWVPSALLMTAAFGSSLGIGAIPWLLSAEYFPTTIRPQVLSITLVTASMCSVISLQLYSPLQALLTPAGLYWFYGVISTLGILYTLVFVYETKGISIG